MISILGLLGIMTGDLWPMERLVYSVTYLSVLGILFSLFEFFKYRGVYYAKNFEDKEQAGSLLK